MQKRPFRNPESHAEELACRDTVKEFLESCGLIDVRDQREFKGKTLIQTVHAKDESGMSLIMSARLCWRKRFGTSDEGYAAFQLLFKVKNEDADASIKSKIDREKARGKTHILAVQRGDSQITAAVMIPIDEVLPLWKQQRDEYDKLIRDGFLGSRRSNPALNGASPTFYIQDDRATSAVSFLRAQKGVRILVPKDERSAQLDDTFDDISDFSGLGRDGAPRFQTIVSGVKRDRAVRNAVVARANGHCERCAAHREYKGFLDVHHILGIEKSDRVWNCVALCPNCHRDSHFSAERDDINNSLLKFSSRYAPVNSKTEPTRVSDI